MLCKMCKLKHVLIIQFAVLLGGFLWAGQVDAASSEIKGALGFNLGEDVSELKLGTAGVIRCKVPFRNFTSCRLYVTVDKKIFGIKSVAAYETAEEAVAEFNVVLDLLQKKYNSQFVDVTSQSRAGVTAYRFQTGDDRYILIQQEKQSVIITYLDRALRTQNQKTIREQGPDKNNNLNTP